jgi:D-lactate dehydrogenase
MKIAVFSSKPYDEKSFLQTNATFNHEMVFFKEHLTEKTCALAEGFDAVCVFVNDKLDASLLEILASYQIRAIALRCAGFNNVDLVAAKRLKIPVVRVPAYSPHAVAEHALALILTLNRKTHRAYNRVREGNFALEGLLGFDLYGKTVGVIGTGKIGLTVVQILKGFGCRLLGYDVYPSDECKALGLEYVSLETLYSQADVITIHCPLTPETQHLINEKAINHMKPGVMLINTSRGAIVDTAAIIEGLKCQKIGALGLDVYEEENELFFEDWSESIIQDDVFSRLLTFPNVLITAHQAFFTQEALSKIATITLQNLTDIETSGHCDYDLIKIS